MQLIEYNVYKNLFVDVFLIKYNIIKKNQKMAFYLFLTILVKKK